MRGPQQTQQRKDAEPQEAHRHEQRRDRGAAECIQHGVDRTQRALARSAHEANCARQRGRDERSEQQLGGPPLQLSERLVLGPEPEGIERSPLVAHLPDRRTARRAEERQVLCHAARVEQAGDRSQADADADTPSSCEVLGERGRLLAESPRCDAAGDQAEHGGQTERKHDREQRVEIRPQRGERREAADSRP